MSKKNRKRKSKVTPVLFKTGDIIKVANYGKGVIKKIEVNDPDFYDFFYFADFTRKGGDGSKVWLPKKKTERQALLLMRDGAEWNNTHGCEICDFVDCPTTCFGYGACPLTRG